MDSLIRLSAIVNRVSCANPLECFDEIRQVFSELPEYECDIAVLPKLALCSPSCGSLFSSPSLASQCEEALNRLRAATRTRNSYVLAGTVVEDWGRPVSAIALLYRGELIALVPALGDGPPLAQSGFSESYLPSSTVFACGEMRFCILSVPLSNLTAECARVSQTGCDLIIIPAYDPVHAGFINGIRETAKAVSGSLGCAIAIVNGGVGDTSSPYAYRGFAAVYECGAELCFEAGGGQSFRLTVDIDADIIHAMKKSTSYAQPKLSVRPQDAKPGLVRGLSRNPWIPKSNPGAYIEDLIYLQSRSLASRMENTGITKLTLAVSGGLDSTAALLASVRAVDILGLPRSNITAITMPGFGTSDHTYYNALSLMEKLGVTTRDIPIKAAVLQHFEDIGHSGLAKDTAYENAQARERTQIALDISNMTGGLMVGPGDLSEAALGFSTFGGDHIANYNVNICITKTALREMIAYMADNGLAYGAEDILRAVLDTPVSPELLPPGESGEIKQRTEDILGPYILHDFFLYYFIKYGFSPEKIYYYACEAFSGEFDPEYIREKLGLFYKKFCSGQFKRACAPDAAGITDINLLGVSFHMPSDLDPSLFLLELEGKACSEVIE